MIVVIEIREQVGTSVDAGKQVDVRYEGCSTPYVTGTVVGYKRDNRTSSGMVKSMKEAE